MFRNRKKQEELEDEPAFFENVAVPATEMTVSYTHLDVYKRQLQLFTLIVQIRRTKQCQRSIQRDRQGRLWR